MTPLPKRRLSSMRQGRRRKAITLKTTNLVKCQNCQALKLSHVVCPTCGTYKGEVLLTPKVQTKVKKVNQDK